MHMRRISTWSAFAGAWALTCGLAYGQFESSFDSGAELSSGLGASTEAVPPLGDGLNDDDKKMVKDPKGEEPESDRWNSRDWDRIEEERRRKERAKEKKENKPKKNRWPSNFHPVQTGYLPQSVPTKSFGMSSAGATLGSSGSGSGGGGGVAQLSGSGFGGGGSGDGGTGGGFGGSGGATDPFGDGFGFADGGFGSPDGLPPGSSVFDSARQSRMSDFPDMGDPFMSDPFMTDPFNLFGEFPWDDLGMGITDFGNYDSPKIPPVF